MSRAYHQQREAGFSMCDLIHLNMDVQNKSEESISSDSKPSQGKHGHLWTSTPQTLKS